MDVREAEKLGGDSHRLDLYESGLGTGSDRAPKDISRRDHGEDWASMFSPCSLYYY